MALLAMKSERGERHISWFIWDIIFLLILCSLSLFLISPYFNANYLLIGYPDWMVHAFRVKFLDTYGLSSWTHTWGNGINMWMSYQFVPHTVTWAVAELARIDIPRAMVLITIALFVLLRVFIYTVLRLLNFSPFAAFAAAIVSFAIASYWGIVRDYSILFGFTFFPLIVYFWVRYYQGKYQLFFPYLLGLCFYLHPLLAISSIGLWLLGILLSKEKLISSKHFIHISIMLAASSLFWFPIVAHQSYVHTNDFITTRYFLIMMLDDYQYFGLSAYVLGCFFLIFISSFMKITNPFRWVKILFFFSFGYFALMVLAMSVDLPQFITKLQITRAMTLVGIGIALSFALVVERVRVLPGMVLKFVLTFFVALAFVDGMWFASVYSAPPTSKMNEMVIDYKNNQTKSEIFDSRIFTSTIGESSYTSLPESRFVNSYNLHLESNQTASRIGQLISNEVQFESLPSESIQRLESYIQLTGTKYIFLDDTYELKKFESLERFKSAGTFPLSEFHYQVFSYDGEVRDAVLVDKKFGRQLEHFPFTLETSDISDQIVLDDHVKSYVGTIYHLDNEPLGIDYPTQTSLRVGIPEQRDSNLVYVNESHDVGWKAYFNNREQKVTPTGPNYMLITLDNLEEGGTLILKHSWPVSFYISIFLIILIPIEILLVNAWRLVFSKSKKKEFNIEKL